MQMTRHDAFGWIFSTGLLLLLLADRGDTKAVIASLPAEAATEFPTSPKDLEIPRLDGYESPVDSPPLQPFDPTARREFRQALTRVSSGSGVIFAAAGDENWWDGFAGTGILSSVSCAVIYQGMLIIGGGFTNAGGIPGTRSIAAWNGTQWFSIANITSGPVNALAIHNGELVVGGGFSINSGAFRRLARWNGASWNSIGTIPSNTVWSLHSVNGMLYAGGDFTSIGGIGASRIANWNGTSWSAMSAGTNNSVHAIVTYRGDIVIGGDFTQSGPLPLSYVARWTDGSWQQLGTGMSPDVVWSLATRDTSLYAGGYFLQAGGVNVNHVARWDGSQWSALGLGVGYEVYSLAFVGDDLWVGGQFNTAGGSGAINLARWDGVAWHPFGIGLAPELSTGWVECVYPVGDSVFVGGNFEHADGVEGINLAAWSNGLWIPVASTGTGTLDEGMSVVKYQDDLVCAGTYTRAGGQAIRYLGRWDGAAWYPMGNPSSAVCDVILYNGNLIAGGYFTSIAGAPFAYVAQWDGVSWQAIGTGMNGPVTSMRVIAGELYAVGAFTMAGGVPANRVARWDGAAWHSLGSGIAGGISPIVYAIQDYGGSIFVGGKFTTAGSVTTKGIARWDGASWADVGGGVLWIINESEFGEPIVYDFETHNGQLVVGGTFTRGGTQVLEYIGSWDGASWSPIGNGVGDAVRSLVNYGPNLIAGGYCNEGGGAGPKRYIVKWNGASWVSLGSGMNNYVRGMSVFDGSLYAVGEFKSAGGKSSFGIARWTDPAVSSVPEAPKPSLTLPYPNPFLEVVTLQYQATARGSYRLDVFDLQGRRIRTLERGEFEAGARQASWDGRDDQARETPPGVYFLRVEGPGGVESFKVVRQR